MEFHNDTRYCSDFCCVISPNGPPKMVFTSDLPQPSLGSWGIYPILVLIYSTVDGYMFVYGTFLVVLIKNLILCIHGAYDSASS